MKKIILFLTVTASFLATSCSDDDNNTTYPDSLNGTTWHRQQTVNQSGQSITIDFYMVFETSEIGHLEAETNSTGANISQVYDFTYEYSQGNGISVFEDSNIGTQDFVVNGNTLTFDGENLTRQ